MSFLHSHWNEDDMSLNEARIKKYEEEYVALHQISDKLNEAKKLLKITLAKLPNHQKYEKVRISIKKFLDNG